MSAVFDELSAVERTFVARSTIVQAVGAVTSLSEGSADALAFELAQRDLLHARDVMEENAAFKELLMQVARDHPGKTKREAQREARALTADPDWRAVAVERSGLYKRLARWL